MEPPLPPFECFGMEYLRVSAVFPDRPLLSAVAKLIPPYTFKKWHYACYLLKYYVSRVTLLRVTHAVHHVNHNLPVGFGPLQRLHRPLHLLYPSLTVGEGAFLLQKG